MKLFSACDEYPGASASLRHSLNRSDCNTPTLVRLKAACKAAKLKFESPFCIIKPPECWTHVAIPALKVAITTSDHHDYKRTSARRKAWEAHGWIFIDLEVRSVAKVSDETLVASLLETLRKLKKIT